MGPRPFMWYLTFYVIVRYTGDLIRQEYNPILALLQPRGLLWVWYGALIVGSAFLLLGSTLLRNYFYGLWLQRIGAVAIGVLTLAYSIILMLQLGFSPIATVYTEFSFIIFSAACFIHFWDVGRYMRTISRAALPSTEEQP